MKPAADGRRVAGRVRVGRLGRPDLRRERGACRLQAGGLVQELRLRLLHVPQRLALGDTRGRETVLAGEQLVAQRAHLVRADGDRADLGRDERAEALRVLALHADPFLGGSDLTGDRAVLRAERLDHLRGIDQVGDALRVEQDLQGARLAVLVEVDQPVAEPVDQRSVLTAVEVEAAGLHPEELGQPVELLPVQLEVALERREPRRDDPDLRVERADLAVDRCDLAGERVLSLLRPGDLRLHSLQSLVDRLFAARDVAARRRRRDGHEGHEDREEAPKAHRS